VVPLFWKCGEGCQPPPRRSGWLSPWLAAWINLRAMFMHGANFFLFKPGIALLLLGLLLTIPLSAGPITVGPVTFSLYWMLLGLSSAILGLQCVFMGILAQVLSDYSGKISRDWLRRFPYTRKVLASFSMFFIRGVLLSFLVRGYFRLPLPPAAALL